MDIRDTPVVRVTGEGSFLELDKAQFHHSLILALNAVARRFFAALIAEAPAKNPIDNTLVLDRAGWHSSVHLRVPDPVHLLFLPAYSPELQPAEHLWPLTNTVLANRHFATIDELEDAQAVRCVALQQSPGRDLVRSTTLFTWWPRRIKRRQGPRRDAHHLARAQ